jgi:hypothetical protein
MSQPNVEAPQHRSVWRRILNIILSNTGPVFGVFLAYELGHAQGFREGVAQMWKAEMAILHSLRKDDDAVTSDL